MEQGLIQIYTGHGKGKTSAAVGLGVRAAGRGLSVVMIQFLKGDDSGEVMFFRDNPGNFTIHRFKPVKKFLKALSEDERKDVARETRRGGEMALDFLKNRRCHILILDEFFGALSSGLLDRELAREIVAARPRTMELVLTGRDAPREFLDMADLVTEMKCIRHPLEKGIPAREGIER